MADDTEGDDFSREIGLLRQELLRFVVLELTRANAELFSEKAIEPFSSSLARALQRDLARERSATTASLARAIDSAGQAAASAADVRQAVDRLSRAADGDRDERATQAKQNQRIETAIRGSQDQLDDIRDLLGNISKAIAKTGIQIPDVPAPGSGVRRGGKSGELAFAVRFRDHLIAALGAVVSAAMVLALVLFFRSAPTSDDASSTAPVSQDEETAPAPAPADESRESASDDSGPTNTQIDRHEETAKTRDDQEPKLSDGRKADAPPAVKLDVGNVTKQVGSVRSSLNNGRAAAVKRNIDALSGAMKELGRRLPQQAKAKWSPRLDSKMSDLKRAAGSFYSSPEQAENETGAARDEKIDAARKVLGEIDVAVAALKEEISAKTKR